MATIDDIETKVNLAITAQESGDYATALRYLRSARMLLVPLPDLTDQSGRQSRFDHTDIDRMINDINKARMGAKGIQTTKIQYRNADSCDD